VSTADLSCIVSGASSFFSCGFVLMSGLRCNVHTSGIRLKRFYPLLCIQDVYGLTALYIASCKCHIKVVEALLVGVDAVLWLYLCSMSCHPDGVASFGCFHRIMFVALLTVFVNCGRSTRPIRN